MDDLYGYFISAELVQRLSQSLQTTVAFSFYQQVEIFGYAVLQVGKEAFQSLTTAGIDAGMSSFSGTSFGNLAGHLLVFHYLQVITGIGNGFQTDNFHRNGRAGALNVFAFFIKQSA